MPAAGRALAGGSVRGRSGKRRAPCNQPGCGGGLNSSMARAYQP